MEKINKKSEEVTDYQEKDSKSICSLEISSNTPGSNEDQVGEAANNRSVQADVQNKIVQVLDYLLNSRQETLVSINKLVGNFARLHGEELRPEVLGFPTMEDLMLNLSRQKNWITPIVGVDDQYLISTEVGKELREERENILIDLIQKSPGKSVTKDAVTVDEVAESNIEVFSLKVGEIFLAEVCQVDSIDNLWVIKQEDIPERTKLMKELNEFYKLSDKKERYKVVELSHCQIGRWMAAKYKNQGMHRVLVKRVLSKQEIEVQYIDYGTSQTVSLKKIYFLSRKFLAWPIMAAHVSMTGDIKAVIIIKVSIQVGLWGFKPVSGKGKEVQEILLETPRKNGDLGVVVEVVSESFGFRGTLRGKHSVIFYNLFDSCPATAVFNTYLWTLGLAELWDLPGSTDTRESRSPEGEARYVEKVQGLLAELLQCFEPERREE